VYPKDSGLSHNEIYAYNNKHSLRSNTKGYGGKTHYTDSQNSDTTTPSGRDLYDLQFSLQAASSETFGYTLVQAYSVQYRMQVVIALTKFHSRKFNVRDNYEIFQILIVLFYFWPSNNIQHQFMDRML
jgi:hypothetical protein